MKKEIKNLLYSVITITISSLILIYSYINTIEELLPLGIVLFFMSVILLFFSIINYCSFKSIPVVNFINKNLLCYNNMINLIEYNITINKHYFIQYYYFSVKDNKHYYMFLDNDLMKNKISEEDLHLLFKIDL